MRVGVTSVVVDKAAFCQSDEQLKMDLLSPLQVLAESFPVPESCCWLQSGKERGRAGDLNKRKKKASQCFWSMNDYEG